MKDYDKLLNIIKGNGNSLKINTCLDLIQNNLFLDEFINSKSYDIRAGVAWQSFGLDKLKDDDNPNVRCAVAENIDILSLTSMMIDDNPNVRCAVARRIGIDMLPLMITDVSIDVRIIVAKNIDPKFFRDMINIEISYDQGISVILEILKRCNIERDAEILDKLISHDSWKIRRQIAILGYRCDILRHDSDRDVSNAAINKLEENNNGNKN